MRSTRSGCSGSRTGRSSSEPSTRCPREALPRAPLVFFGYRRAVTTKAAARWAGVIALCASACVSKSKHEAATAKLADAEAESAALRRERDRLQGELEAAKVMMEG